MKITTFGIITMKQQLLLLLLLPFMGNAQLLTEKPLSTHADSLRGQNGPLRNCYNVQHYAIDIVLDVTGRGIAGSNTISFSAVETFNKIQLDLFANMQIDSILFEKQTLNYTRDGNAFFVSFNNPITKNSTHNIQVFYHGKPQIAVRAPWDGGFVFTKDEANNDWVAVACQGTGASLWYPCKDHPGDEPDSASLSTTIPSDLMSIGNGRLRNTKKLSNGFTKYTWAVTNPINNYDLSLNIGKYAHYTDTFINAEGQKLSMDFYPMAYNIEKSKPQFAQAKPMLKCFEQYFGKYPFYEDGYKLVETPYLGMEHQSAVAYGNGYVNGYKGYDIWGSGEGKKFDYIVIHESGHEWWGNSITAADQADMWLQESMTTYSETLYLECMYGKASADKYINAGKGRIANTEPIQGLFGLNREGSGDMYPKGALFWHTLRGTINNDEVFFGMIKSLSSTFYHKTVSYTDLLNFVNRYTRSDYTSLFTQYIQGTAIPKLEIVTKGKALKYRWIDVPPTFSMRINMGNGQYLNPSSNWQSADTNREVLRLAQQRQYFLVSEK